MRFADIVAPRGSLTPSAICSIYNFNMVKKYNDVIGQACSSPAAGSKELTSSIMMAKGGFCVMLVQLSPAGASLGFFATCTMDVANVATIDLSRVPEI